MHILAIACNKCLVECRFEPCPHVPSPASREYNAGMNDERKQPGAGFWAVMVLAALLVAVVLYVASAIVIVELGRRGILADRSLEDSVFFYPLKWILFHLVGNG